MTRLSEQFVPAFRRSRRITGPLVRKFLDTTAVSTALATVPRARAKNSQTHAPARKIARLTHPFRAEREDGVSASGPFLDIYVERGGDKQFIKPWGIHFCGCVHGGSTDQVYEAEEQ